MLFFSVIEMGHKCKDERLQKGRYVTINVTECPTFMFRPKISNSEANIERYKLNVEIFLASKFVERYLYTSTSGSCPTCDYLFGCSVFMDLCSLILAGRNGDSLPYWANLLYMPHAILTINRRQLDKGIFYSIHLRWTRLKDGLSVLLDYWELL